MSREPNKPLPPSPRELIVIARPEVGLRVTDKGVESLKYFDVKFLNDLLRNPERSLRPLFRPSKELPKRGDDYGRIKGGVALPDLSVYFRLFAPDEELESLARQLLRQPIIETAYVKPGAVPPVWDTNILEEDGPPLILTHARASVSASGLSQGYLDDPPGGIGARSVWSYYEGGNGTGVKIIDIEGAWRFSHNDLEVNQGGLAGGTQNNVPSWKKHGTAVLGVIGGDENDFGITGICPGAHVQAVSKFRPGPDPLMAWGSASAIQYAADMLDGGDIILVELQYPGPNAQPVNNQSGYIPVEWWDDNLRAIQYATSRGVLVVEAGGNGQEDLDDAIYNSPPPSPAGPFGSLWQNPFNRELIDSGAIIVGAGAPPPGTHGVTTALDCSRLDFSNYGSVFDAQGWGMRVETCGGAGEVRLGASGDDDLRYTKLFSGTSSAAAMVTGALGCIQGARKGAGLAPLTPLEARELLRRPDLGSPQQAGGGTPTTKPIGSRPNLLKMIAAVVP